MCIASTADSAASRGPPDSLPCEILGRRGSESIATPEEHFQRYGELRARLLAQHFAYSRHRRVNFL
jgi:hypothetical protein